MRLSSYFVLIVLLLSSGCGLLPEQVDKTKDWSASQLYAAAKEAMNDKNYEKAIDYFEKLEARYRLAVMPSRRSWKSPTPTTSLTNPRPRLRRLTVSSRSIRAIRTSTTPGTSRA
jgi:hypothetical protein